MAEKLDAFPVKYSRSKMRRWDEWLNGDVWKLDPATDLAGLTTPRNSVYAAAAARGVKVRVTVLDDGSVVIQALRTDEQS